MKNRIESLFELKFETFLVFVFFLWPCLWEHMDQDYMDQEYMVQEYMDQGHMDQEYMDQGYMDDFIGDGSEEKTIHK